VGDSEKPSNAWRRSKASDAGSGSCVEVSITSDSVFVRHSHRPDGHMLEFSPAEWEAFLAVVRNGEFDTDQSAS
jgi:Domain of unknown function (DUF397)